MTEVEGDFEAAMGRLDDALFDDRSELAGVIYVPAAPSPFHHGVAWAPPRPTMHPDLD